MTEPAFPLPPIDHVSIVVKDIEKAVKFYSSTFGFGPFRLVEADMKDPAPLLRGKPTPCRIKEAKGQAGPIELQLLQILAGEVPSSRVLPASGEGLDHIGCRVPDCDAFLARLAEQGIKPVWYHKTPRVTVAFVEVMGGVMLEIVQR